MSPNRSREEAFNAIAGLKGKYGGSVNTLHQANEAKTRLLIINKVLNVLGWADDDFNPEQNVGASSFTDYLLTVDGIPHLVVEAKKARTTFVLQIGGTLRKETYTLKYLKSAFGEALSEVIEQAKRYADLTSIPFALITNGREWILLQVAQPIGSNSGIDDLMCYYFGDILSDDFNFDLFWQMLNKDNIAEGFLEEHFANLNLKEAEFYAEPLEKFGQIQWRKATSVTYLWEFYDCFFSDITDINRHEMLARCYVTNTQLDQYQKEMARTLRDTAPAYIPQAQELSPDQHDQVLHSHTGDAAGRVIIITGSVGCGKSTFVAKVLAETRSSRQFIGLKIDLIDEILNSSQDITSILWRRVETEWKSRVPESYYRENLEKIFGRDVASLRKGARSELYSGDDSEFTKDKANLLAELVNNLEYYFKHCWEHYRQRNHDIAVFFDNVDRASQEFQEKVYAFAHKLANLTGVTVVITMREVTFFRGKEGGFLDVRSSDIVYHLQSPNPEILLSKRISYIEQYIEQDPRAETWHKRFNWDEFMRMVHAHAEILKRTFLVESNGRMLLSLLGAVAWHDVRFLLETLYRVHSQLGSDTGIWTYQEIVTALIAPENSTGGLSELANIFRPPFENFPCYYLKIRILLMLVAATQEHERRRGISIARIRRFTRIYGYQRTWTTSAIEQLVQQRLLECIEVPAADEYTKDYKLSESHSFRPSPLAIHLVESIVDQPIYLGLIGNNLPFHNRKAFEDYCNAMNQVLETLDNRQFERVAVELVADDKNLARIVAKYLMQALQNEQPPSNLRNDPEVAATERKLDEIELRLQSVLAIEIIEPPAVLFSYQAPLFATDIYSQREQVLMQVPIPPNLRSLRVSRSSYGPMIFWALAVLKVCFGQDLVTGSEITNIINSYLMDDVGQKHAPNVSRALRYPTLQTQPWLETISGANDRPIYKLVDNWEEYWERVFGAPFSLGRN